MKLTTLLILAALAIHFIIAVAWKAFEIADCRNDGGTVAFTMLRAQHSAMPAGE